MRKDFRVDIAVRFTIDLSAVEPVAAQHDAMAITRSIFEQNFSRAECVQIAAGSSLEIRPIHLKKKRAKVDI